MSTILIIEDHLEIRENTAELLEISGFNIISATNGKDGVKIASKKLPDVILCDIMLPELNGYEVITQLKSTPTTAKIPFIFFTARTEKKEIDQGIQLGADGYICKPFDEKDLINAINAHLRK